MENLIKDIMQVFYIKEDTAKEFINILSQIVKISDKAYERGLESGKKVIKHLENMPSAQSERKMGHWERDNTYHGDDASAFLDPNWRCSECGGQAIINNWFMYDLTDFCPNCGADMRGN